MDGPHAGHLGSARARFIGAAGGSVRCTVHLRRILIVGTNRLTPWHIPVRVGCVGRHPSGGKRTESASFHSKPQNLPSSPALYHRKDSRNLRHIQPYTPHQSTMLASASASPPSPPPPAPRGSRRYRAPRALSCSLMFVLPRRPASLHVWMYTRPSEQPGTH